MSKHVLITGGTGFIGSKLCEHILKKEYRITIFSRNPDKVKFQWGNKIAAIHRLEQIQHIDQPDWVINLAGEPIIGRPWTERRKALLRESRIQLTTLLLNELSHLTNPPEVMISGSAVGYYGDAKEACCTEDSDHGTDFAANLCHDWEQAAQPITARGTRLCVLRTGIVLGKDGGMLAKMLLPFKLGLGGKIGTGKQWLSWIQLDDICRLIIHLAENESCSGPFNATSPNPVTNETFTKTLGSNLKRPTVMGVPALLLKTVLGEASILLIGGQKVLPKKALDSGFQFNYSDLDTCLKF